MVFNAKCKGNNKVSYDFEAGYTLDFEDEIKYDGKCTLSPRITSVVTTSITWTFEYDALGRLSNKKTGNLQMTTTYKSGTALAEKLACIKHSLDHNYQIINDYINTVTQSYDKRGNVTSVTVKKLDETTSVNSYEYNAVNQLIKEEYAEKGKTQFTRRYYYDQLGNITRVDQSGQIEEYRYEFGRLKSVTENGNEVENYTYDNFGNPTCFKSSSQNMWWERGTYLKRYERNGAALEYTYDAQGHMVGKNGTRYYYDGDKLLAMNVNNTRQARFIYDVEGIAGFKVNGNENSYLYHKDAQGNVVALIYDEKVIARYVYDAWGNSSVVVEDVTKSDMAYFNPIRWKSQFYDTDSGLYWIGDRWYDPERGRYISSASPEMLLQNASIVYATNLYAFCITNPLAVLLAAYTVLPK